MDILSPAFRACGHHVRVRLSDRTSKVSINMSSIKFGTNKSIISSPPPSTSSSPPPPPWRSRPLSRPLHPSPGCPTSQTATFPSSSSSKTGYPLLLGSRPPSRLPSCRHRPRRHCGHPTRPVLSIVVRGRVHKSEWEFCRRGSLEERNILACIR